MISAAVSFRLSHPPAGLLRAKQDKRTMRTPKVQIGNSGSHKEASWALHLRGQS